jgi:hypothetical protein
MTMQIFYEMLSLDALPTFSDLRINCFLFGSKMRMTRHILKRFFETTFYKIYKIKSCTDCGCTAWNFPQDPLEVCDLERMTCFQQAIKAIFYCLHSRDRCYDFSNISPKYLAKILAFFAQTTASFCKNCYHNIGF